MLASVTNEVGKAREKADLSALQALLDAAKAKLRTASQYTAASVLRLMNAVAEADEMLAKNDVDIAERDRVMKTLQSAVNGLKKKPDPTVRPNPVQPDPNAPIDQTPAPTAPVLVDDTLDELVTLLSDAGAPAAPTAEPEAAPDLPTVELDDLPVPATGQAPADGAAAPVVPTTPEVQAQNGAVNIWFVLFWVLAAIGAGGAAAYWLVVKRRKKNENDQTESEG